MGSIPKSVFEGNYTQDKYLLTIKSHTANRFWPFSQNGRQILKKTILFLMNLKESDEEDMSKEVSSGS